MIRSLPQRFTAHQDLPSSAVILSKQEVRAYFTDRIQKWHPQREVWPFRFQHQVIGGSTALTCVVLDQVVRKIFLLGRYKPLVTLLPTLVIPSVTSMLGFGLGVTHKILVGDGDCISCFAIRGGGFQMLLATVYPLLLSPLSCYLLAREYHTYGGHFNKNQVELIKMLRVPKGAKSLVGALMIGNYLLGAFLAYNQVQCFDNVLTKPNQPQNEDLKGLE